MSEDIGGVQYGSFLLFLSYFENSYHINFSHVLRINLVTHVNLVLPSFV